MAALVSATPTMTSLEIAQLTGKAHRNVMRDTRAMLVELHGEGGVLKFEHTQRNSQNGQDYAVFRLPRRECLILVSGYDLNLRARIIDRWEELERGAQPIQGLTAAQQFLALAQITVDLERAQNEHLAALIDVNARVSRVEASQTVMSSCPAAAESISRIRARMNERYGLSAATVDAVMRQSPYTPKPAGTVRNAHEEAEGSTFAVFWRKDVSLTFERFVSECEMVTATMASHPFVEGRFKLTGRAAS